MDRPAGCRICLCSTERLDAILTGMYREAAGFPIGRTKVAIVGMLGLAATGRLQQRLKNIRTLRDCLRLDLKIQRHADDLALLYPETRLTESAEQAAPDKRRP